MADQEYVDLLDEEIEGASGGGGMIGMIAIFPAFKCFIKNLKPHETTFTYLSKEEKETAKARAKALCAQHGAESEPQQTVTLVQYKDTVVGRDVSKWQGDQYHPYGIHWGVNAKKLNALRKELKIASGQKVWARTSWMVCPDAEAEVAGQNPETPGTPKWAWEKDQDEQWRVRRMVIPVAVYADKAEAEAAAESGAVETVSDPSYPGGDWTLDGWNACKPDIIATAKKGVKQGIPAAVTYGELAERYEVTPEQIQLVVEAA